MSNEIKIAGLSEIQANKILFNWMVGRSGLTRFISHSNGGFFGKLRNYEPFTQSHDSIQLVLDAMNQSESDEYYHLWIDGADGPHPADMRDALHATLAKKCELALYALGLGAVL